MFQPCDFKQASLTTVAHPQQKKQQGRRERLDCGTVGKERIVIEPRMALGLSSYGARIRALRHIVGSIRVGPNEKTTINRAVNE